MSWWMWLLAYLAGFTVTLLVTLAIQWRTGDDPDDDPFFAIGCAFFWPLVWAGIAVFGPLVGLIAGGIWITKPRSIRRKEREQSLKEQARAIDEELKRLEREAGIR